MAGVRAKPRKGKYQGWYIDYEGKRRYFTGSRNRKETLSMAQRLEDEHKQVRLGYRPAPTPQSKNHHESFQTVKQEYLAWGEAQGGRNGFPWSTIHTRMRTRHLDFWETELSLVTLGDIKHSIRKVESVVQRLLKNGSAPKTVSNHIESLQAICNWCMQRSLLESNPLQNLASLNTDPLTERRVMTIDEINRILNACYDHERLLLETALSTGLRAKELRHLDLVHLDVQESELRLEASWTKDRKKQRHHPLPEDLTRRLMEFVSKNGANEIYEKWYGPQKRPKDLPSNPLVNVSSHPARTLDRIMKRAGVEKKTKDGKVDFHACRVAYINMLSKNESNIKVIHELARHSDPRITIDKYLKATSEQKRNAVEKIAQKWRNNGNEE